MKWDPGVLAETGHRTKQLSVTAATKGKVGNVKQVGFEPGPEDSVGKLSCCCVT